NGVLKSRTAYEQGKRQGMQAGWDSAGRLLNRSFYKDDLADGYSMRYGSSRNLMEKGGYRAGKKVGSWYFYRSKGSLASYERYNDSGMMLFVQHYDEQGKPQTFDSLRQYREAGPSGGLNAFYEAISKEYHVPPEAIKKNLETQIELCFEIDEQGNPVNLRACNEPRLAKVLEDEALRSFNAIKTQWNPQWQHNRPVSTHYKLPIKVTIMR
ncbi:MAG: energy transducer TonB, partial [Bacteroidetes bacterium]|nr:energy transducer TonB [Bacteroidota bacterium]